MKKSERIERLEGMLERMASQNGRDLRELAKARGEIKQLQKRLDLQHGTITKYQEQARELKAAQYVSRTYTFVVTHDD